jgi:hypothetical protein
MRGTGSQTPRVKREAMNRNPPRVRVVTGLAGGAWLRRGVLYVARARTAAATELRTARALAAASRTTAKE